MSPVLGAYLLTGHDGPYAVERFRFDGITYAAECTDPVSGALLGRLEVVVGPEVRLHVELGPWVLRGGTVGPDVLWRRGQDEQEARADGFGGTSPAYAMAVVRRLGLEVGQERRLRLVEVTEPVLATRIVDVSWARTAEDDWAATDLATGERRVLQLVDGLVVSGSGLSLTRL